MNKKFLNTLYDLGLKEFENNISPIAVSCEGELKINPKLKAGSMKDCVYFIFRNYILDKIGKVGGGGRCMRMRALDYRSTDPTGVKIKQAIGNGEKIHIIAIYFEEKIDSVFGINTEGASHGPKLEKALIPIARAKGYNLIWNKNNG